MADIGREGHRERLRETYIKAGIEPMHDRNIIELLLTYAIPRKDVKPIAYNLMNRFNSLENIFSASITELEQVDGMGRISASLISLVTDINKKIALNRNAPVKKITSASEAALYFENCLLQERHEQLMVLSLNNANEIINCHVVSKGSVNCSEASSRAILELIMQDSASSVIVAHNHPKGKNSPSAADVNFTVTVLGMLRQINVRIIDHIIVGTNGAFSMRSSPAFELYFS